MRGPRVGSLQVRAEDPYVIGSGGWIPGSRCSPSAASDRRARGAIVAVKEHGRRDLIAPLVWFLVAGGPARRLGCRGLLLTVVPGAPPAAWAARRGGDPITRIAVAAAAVADPRITVVPALRTSALVRDSVGLGIARERNSPGRVRLTAAPARGEVPLVDDVLTTG